MPCLLLHCSVVVCLLAAVPAAQPGDAARPAANPTAKRFERLDPAATGVRFRNDIAPDHALNFLYHSGFSGGGVAVGDVDGDGRPDLYLVSGPGSNVLYRQTGDFRFVDITAAAGVDGGDSWGAGATMVDIDGDGDLDLYVCNYESPNQLFLNDGAGGFAEAAAERGLAIVDASLTPAFCDYDRDGDLDLFLLTYRVYRPGGRPENPLVRLGGQWTLAPEFERYYALRPVKDDKSSFPYRVRPSGRPDLLLRNDGSGKFEDVTASSGMAGRGQGLSATWWDYDADGWPDLYVCNDFDDPDRLYHNNGDGTFTDTLEQSVPHTTWFSMGSDAADLNNDGWVDFLAADMSATTHLKQKTTMGVMNAAQIAAVAGPPPQVMRNNALLNTGTGRFLEGAYLLGVADSDWSWAVKLADFDNDGWVDAFISNGMTRDFNNSDIPFDYKMMIGRTQWDIYRDAPTRPERNLAWRNTGDLEFVDVGESWGLDHTGMSFGTAWADFDGNGALDLVVVNLDEPASVYRNRSTANWLTVKLQGTRSNRHGIGAEVRIRTPRGVQVRQLFPTTGVLSSNEALVHFGLGDETRIEEMVVRWPSGVVQHVGQPAANQRHVVTETAPAEPVSEPTPAPETLFVRSAALDGAVHREVEFDDFALQPLLPNKLSQLGPGIAWGDVDGDGDDDFFLGGATGEPGQLWRNEGAGRFAPIVSFELSRDRGCEDLGALLFDADGDGDLDLYVVSGGVEKPAGTPRMRDRLYHNDGTGQLAKAARALPRTADSGSVVAAADFDRDGDLDLFVGGRVLQGRYPRPANSHLLRNDGGQFADVTAELAPGLTGTGLVTSAIWSDADGDGWCDLLVTHEWGPVKLFRNGEGRLVDATADAQLAAHTGWWNGIAAGDLDGDRDIDYVVTNFGLNTKYHASSDTPALIYLGDFEHSGREHVVEAEFEDGTLFPVRGKSCSTRAMPFLGEKFKSFRDFGLASLGEVYSDEDLAKSARFEATTLESGVLLNDGKGRFVFRPLPRLAQIAPSFGVVVQDVDADGHPDVYLVQNFFGPQPETGNMDGGLSLLLAGRGDGTFEPVWPARSGLIEPRDATALATVDLNGDGRLDFAIGVNGGPVSCFLRTETGSPRFVSVRLRGRPGNPTAIGARVTLHRGDGRTQTAEIHAGGSYLAQSSPTLAFGLGEAEPQAIEVRWPDGRTTRHPGESGRTHYAIAQGAAGQTGR